LFNTVVRGTVVGFVATLCAGYAMGQSASPASCENLSKLTLPEISLSITSAQTVAAGELKMEPLKPGSPGGPGGPAAPPPGTGGGPGTPGGFGGNRPKVDFTKLPVICRVQGTAKPSANNELKFEIWLPLTNWNESTVTVTHPSSAGGNVNAEVVDAIQKGYAGVLNMSPSFDDWVGAAKSEGQLLDQGYRDEHVIIVSGKAIAKAFYGKPVKHAYYEGCSEGGREGLNAAHHYPEDYDGIIIGGAGIQFALINAAQMYPAWYMSKHPGSFIPQKKWTMIHNAVLDACDEIDGVKDQVIEDPRQCNFKPESLLCKGEENDTCLTAPQVDALKATYKGLTNPRTGEVLFPGPAVGGELPVFEFANPDVPMHPAHMLYQKLVFGDKPDWDWKTLDMDKDIDLAIKKVGPALQTVPSDLKDFLARGGKLIIWDGWNDYNNPYFWMDFYSDLQKQFGAVKVDEHVKMYFLPGVQHCGGGEGCDNFSKLGAISEWVTTGNAPARIHSSHVTSGAVTKTHPVCPYPQVSKFKGTGDINDEANWVCMASKPGYK
jgi:feruloyl esterase